MQLFLKLISILPFKIVQNIACTIGALLYTFNSSLKKTTSTNLSIAYPQLTTKKQNELVKKSLKHQCMTYAESIKIWGESVKFSQDKIVKVHGSEFFFNALTNENGALAIVPHYGNWEIMNAWVSQHTNPVILYKPQKNQILNNYMLASRQRLNAKLVPTDETGVRALFKHLKQGGFSAILPDHIPKGAGGIYSPFYGKNVLTSTLLSKLASKTQCTVIGMYCLRNDDLSGFDLFITPISDEILSKDIQLSVNALNTEIENMINIAPEQYLWGYKRFRKYRN